PGAHGHGLEAHRVRSLSDGRGGLGSVGARPTIGAMATRLRHPEIAPKLSVVVLVFNEAESIAPLHEELMGVLEGLDIAFEVLYIDDGSRDGSTERLAQLAQKDPHVRVVSFRRNFGQTAAVQAGIDNARG